jgi:O-glycosyl hydrolase
MDGGAFMANGSERNQEEPTVIIDPTIQYHVLEGWGTSLCWWGNACGNWKDKAKKDDLIEKVFGEDGLALNVVRYNIGGSENPDHDHMRPGGEVPGYQVTEGTYDWTADPGQRYVLQGAVDQGVNVTEAFLNSPPYWMTYSRCTAGSLTGLTDNLLDGAVDSYTDYITEVLKHFSVAWNIDFDFVSAFNEPSTPFAWREGGSQEGCHYFTGKQNDVIVSLGNSLTQKGLRTQISAPEETFLDWAITTYNGYDGAARECLRQLNVHLYHGTMREQVKCLAFHENKRLWMSEVGFGGSSGHDHDDILLSIQVAEGIISDMRYLQPVSWVYWQVVENETYDSNWGMIHANFSGTNDFSLTKAYYGFGQFTKFIRPGYRFIGSGVDNAGDHDIRLIAAYGADDRKAVFVVLCEDLDPASLTFSLAKFESVGAVNAYRTSPTENLARLPDIAVIGGMFDAILEARSITTFVVNDAYLANDRVINDIEVGSGLNQMNFVGEWDYAYEDGCQDSDNHFSSNADSYATIAFYGTGYDIYSSTDNDLGIFGVSVDDSGETMIDCYSSRRENIQLLYREDNLKRGRHTITIRVTGEKNALSSAATVIVDRVDVFDGR